VVGNMKRTYIMPLVVLTAICLVVSGALAFMDSITSPVILAAVEERTQAVMAEIIPNAMGFEHIELGSVNGLPSTIRDIYRTTNGVGYILIASVNGFSGDVTVICAVDQDGVIIAASTLSHTETKGIGTILEQESFLDPFKGVDSSLEGIDTVSGATISTRAFIRAIQDIMETFELMNGQVN
jgi:electron transport complex protein RnfG